MNTKSEPCPHNSVLESAVASYEGEQQRKGPAFICHFCHRLLCDRKTVKCNNQGCNKWYCLKCLTKYYKYSRVAAKTLQTTKNWVCAVCKGKCPCENCWLSGNSTVRKPEHIIKTGNRLKKETAQMAEELRSMNVLKSEPLDERPACRVQLVQSRRKRDQPEEEKPRESLFSTKWKVPSERIEKISEVKSNFNSLSPALNRNHQLDNPTSLYRGAFSAFHPFPQVPQLPFLYCSSIPVQPLYPQCTFYMIQNFLARFCPSQSGAPTFNSLNNWN